MHPAPDIRIHDPADRLWRELDPSLLRPWSIPGARIDAIGRSESGRPLHGIRVGRGPLRASITAGAHADEPVGPRAAVLLARALAEGREPWALRLADAATFWIVPDANPDGAADNAAWSARPGDFAAWLARSRREPPGRDVEFNYPRHARDRATRPENLAIADFLRSAGGPFHLHLSLHSMAIADGAWLLVGPEWTDRARRGGLLDAFAASACARRLRLHDADRRGDKGFHRIAPGFATTPNSRAMAEHFLRRGDRGTAALFRPSSMEFVRSLGGDPLCLVTEVPSFVPDLPWADCTPFDARPAARLRAAIAQSGRTEEEGRLLARRHRIRAVRWKVHAELQLRAVAEGVRLAAGS